MNRSRMSFRMHKKKIKITESSHINFTYIINPRELKCQCMTETQKPQQICKHLEYYLCEHLKVHPSYIALLPIKRFREAFLADCNFTDGNLINQECHKFLTEEEEGCCICQESYFQKGQRYNVKELYQCPSCYELYHMTCYSKWNKECPRCKYIHSFLKRDI